MHLPRARALREKGVLAVCAEALELEKAGDYQAAWGVLSAYWTRIGEPLRLDGLDEVEKAEVRLRVGMLTCRMGNASEAPGVLDTAKDLLTASLTAFEALENEERAGQACYGLGLCFQKEGSFNEACIWLQSAIDRFKNDSYQKFKALLMMAITEVGRGRYHDAVAIHRTLGEIAGTLTDDGLLGAYHNEHAIVLKKLGAIESSDERLDQALIEYAGAEYHFEKAGNKRNLSSVLNNIGGVLLLLKRPDEAMRYVDNALLLAEAIKDKVRQAEFLDSKAQIHLRLCQFQLAERAARRSIDLLRFSGQQSLLAGSMLTHARVLVRVGNTTEARRVFNDAEVVANHVGDYESAGRALLFKLEDIADMSAAERLSAHAKIFECLKNTQDAGIARRHNDCLQQTVILLQQSNPDMKSREHFSLDKQMYEFEKDIIEHALKSSGSLTEAAALLDVSVATLHHKLKTKFKELKKSQVKTYRRSYSKNDKVVRLGDMRERVATFKMQDDSLLNLGIERFDRLIIKKGLSPVDGKPALVQVRKETYVGIYEKKEDRVYLKAANPDYEEIWFEADSVSMIAPVLAFIKAAEAGKPDATIHEL